MTGPGDAPREDDAAGNGDEATDGGTVDGQGDDPGARVDTHVGTGTGAPAAFDPPGDAPVECGSCGRPFADEELLALHRGHAHPGALTDEEREAFEDAYESETADLRRFQLKAAGLVVVLYFGFLMLYALV